MNADIFNMDVRKSVTPRIVLSIDDVGLNHEIADEIAFD